MHFPYARRLAMGGAAAALLAATAACGTSAARVDAAPSRPADQSAVALVSSAGDSLEKAGSAKFHFSAGFSGADGSLDVSGTGAVDSQAKAMSLAVEIPPILGAAGTAEVRVVGGTVYLRLPAPLGTGGWLSLPADPDLGAAQPPSQDLRRWLGELDPQRMVAAMRSSVDVRVAGSEDVAGVRATHLTGTIDPATLVTDLAAASGGSGSGKAAELSERLRSDVGRIPFDAWIDQSGRPVKLTAKVTFGPQAAKPGTLDLSLSISDYGKPVQVVAPDGAVAFDPGTGIPGLLDAAGLAV